MKITSVRACIMGIPSPGGQAPSRNWIFVRVETDQGISGVGEATTEYHEHAVVAMVEHHFGPLLIGQDPTRVNHAWQQMQRCFWWRGGVVASSAASGIEQALWDITGKSWGVPVHQLLGGRVRDRVRLYARGDLGLTTPVAEAEAALAEGFDAFKLGLGPAVTPYCDEQQVDVAIRHTLDVRNSVGPACDIMLDCGGILSLPAAHRLIASTTEARLRFIEEPVHVDTPHKLAELRRSFPAQRIAAGERLMTRWQFREWVESRALDVIQADLSHCGGIGELLRIAAYAEIYGIDIAPHNPYGPVALAANTQAALCLPNFMILEHCRLRPWFDAIQVIGPSVSEGYVIPNDRPGLGIELDWNYVERHPYQARPLRTYQNVDGSLPLI